MIVVNAANVAAAWEHIVDLKGGANVRLKDISSDVGLIAIQGPDAEKTLQPLADLPLSDIAYYHHDNGKIAGCQCFISRTGYTGEDGFELYCRWKDTPTIWEALLTAGALPIGLGARDSLRLEMGYALYGHEIDRNITPLEAGLAWIVKLNKGAPFTGADALGGAEGARCHPEAGGLQAARAAASRGRATRCGTRTSRWTWCGAAPRARRSARPSARRSFRPMRRRSAPSSRSSAAASGFRPRSWRGRSGRMAR